MILSTESEWQRSSEDIATRPADEKTIAGDPMHGFLLIQGVLGSLGNSGEIQRSGILIGSPTDNTGEPWPGNSGTLNTAVSFGRISGKGEDSRYPMAAPGLRSWSCGVRLLDGGRLEADATPGRLAHQSMEGGWKCFVRVLSRCC